MSVSVRFARGAVMSLATAGLIGVSAVAAAAGEGSSDIGRQPPYGYFANERGRSAPGADLGPAPYGSPGARAGRTSQVPRSRR
jgi:hypothetical protein